MNKKVKITALIVASSLYPTYSISGPYDFSYSDKSNMASAFWMCSVFAFVPGKCPKVLQKCFMPEMLYLQAHNGHFHVRSHCTKAPNISVTTAGVSDAIATAAQTETVPHYQHTYSDPQTTDAYGGDWSSYQSEIGYATKEDVITSETNEYNQSLDNYDPLSDEPPPEKPMTDTAVALQDISELGVADDYGHDVVIPEEVVTVEESNQQLIGMGIDPETMSDFDYLQYSGNFSNHDSCTDPETGAVTEGSVCAP